MSEMVDRVAKALFDASHMDPIMRAVVFGDNPGLGFANLAVPIQDHFRGHARAVIQAMREPTDEMVLAGDDHLPATTIWGCWPEPANTQVRKIDDFVRKEFENDGEWVTVEQES